MTETPISEQQILEALRCVPVEQWVAVLSFIKSLQKPEGTTSPATSPLSSTERRWTAAELLKLPLQERDAILAAQAGLAEEEYRTNPALTAFEAFGKDDLYGESSSTETR